MPNGMNESLKNQRIPFLKGIHETPTEINEILNGTKLLLAVFAPAPHGTHHCKSVHMRRKS